MEKNFYPLTYLELQVENEPCFTVGFEKNFALTCSHRAKVFGDFQKRQKICLPEMVGKTNTCLVMNKKFPIGVVSPMGKIDFMN